MGPQVENNQASAHLGSKGFHMAFESWTSAQQSPRYVPDKFGPIRPFILHGPKGSLGPILYIFLNVVPMSLKKVFCESSGNTFCKIAELVHGVETSQCQNQCQL